MHNYFSKSALAFIGHHGLSDGDDVRNDTLKFEGPPVAADASESDLNLVGNADPASLADVMIDLRQVLGRQNDLT
jgi:hypothetical protein